jgi:hypothetical protein
VTRRQILAACRDELDRHPEGAVTFIPITTNFVPSAMEPMRVEIIARPSGLADLNLVPTPYRRRLGDPPE